MYTLENGGIQQWLLLGLAINVGLGVGVGGLQKAFGRSARPSLLKYAQNPGSSPWL